jgi:hypothetical protein
MIIGRLALFFAILFGVATTQLPEYMQQYRQRLGGAIDELTAIVARFDTEAGAQGLSEAGGVARLETNPDPLAKARGKDMADMISRLDRLNRAATALDGSNAFVKWGTFLTTFEPHIAERAYASYQPAVPTTADGFLAGLIGFIVGGGLIHVLGLPIRYRHKLFHRPHVQAHRASASTGTGRTS